MSSLTESDNALQAAVVALRHSGCNWNEVSRHCLISVEDARRIFEGVEARVSLIQKQDPPSLMDLLGCLDENYGEQTKPHAIEGSERYSGTSDDTSFCAGCGRPSSVEPQAWQPTQIFNSRLMISRLLSGVISECPLCKLYSRIINWASQRYREDYTEFLINMPPNHPVQMALYSTESTLRSSRYFTIYPSPETPETLATILPAKGRHRRVQNYPLSLETIDLIRNWLEDCRTNHVLCTQQTLTCPTRLIHIGSSTEMEPPVHLVEDTGLIRRYIALSHTWGLRQTLVTTSSNIEAMKASIEWSTLPKTFKDAIKVCQLLGYDYLWVDSLCILQDNQKDWEIESAQMGNIYRNADLVLAATSSTGDEHGFLDLREASLGDNESTVLSTFPVIWLDSTYNIQVSTDLIHYTHYFAGEPLSTRAWTFQERLLARRFLSFNQYEVHFECETSWRCECGTGDLVAYDHHPYNLQAMLTTADPALIYSEWYRKIIPRYSQRYLTKSSDKLPAISAVASMFQLKLIDHYVAGLWSHDLAFGLIWRKALDLHYDPLAPMYRAPSWSWASIDGTVELPHRGHYTNTITILEANCDLVSSNPTGEVSSGSLVIRGSLAPAWVRLPPSGTFHRNILTLAKPNQEALIDIACFNVDSLLVATTLEEGDRGIKSSTSLSRNVSDALPPGTWERDDYVDKILSDCKNRNAHPFESNIPSVWCLYVGHNAQARELHQVEESDEWEYKLNDDSHWVLVLGRNPDQLDSFTRLGIAQMNDEDFEAIFIDGEESTITIF